MNSDQPTGNGDSPRASLVRSPWFWGVVAGLIFVPAIRPLTRHIPDAPPVLAELPDFELRLSGGSSAASAELRGRVYVLGFHGELCEPGCGPVLTALRALSERFQEFDRGITVVAVRLAAAGEVGATAAVDFSGSWLMGAASVEGLAPVAREALTPHLGAEPTGAAGIVAVAAQARLFIVDAQGKLRGHYGIDELGLDEVYHRAQHVLRDHRGDGIVPR